ncbi:MAG: ECF RNA polymerase sigma factor SigW [Phycisphaerae bacterium]|nr:ECF RNA polymerase sigma factor SigW [Phycisphaerae bacterium]
MGAETPVNATDPLPESPSDAECVRQTLRGATRAFDELIGRYQQRSTSIAYRLLGNLHDALEVCQESFVRAFGRLDQLDDPARFRPWLLRIVTNLSLNYRRQRAVSGATVSLDAVAVERDASPDAAFEPPSAATSRPDEDVAADELSAGIRQALDELTAQQRSALVLFSIEQLPQREVAEIMDCSVEAVKWHVFQARKQMREKLAAYL